MQGRDLYWDAVKGFGYLCVLVGHMDQARYIYIFHMPMFFIVSGLFFSPGNLRRIARNLVAPWLYFWMICTLLHCMLDGGVVHFRRFIRTSAMGCPYVCDSMWFLSALIVVQLVSSWAFPWLDRHLKSKTIFCGYFVLLFCLGFFASKVSTDEVLLYTPMKILSVPMALFFFSMGYYGREVIRNLFSTFTRTKAVLWLAILLPPYCVLSHCLGFSSMYRPIFSNIVVFVVLALIGSVCVGLIIRLLGNGWMQHSLAWIGCCSICYFLIEQCSIEASVKLSQLILGKGMYPVYWVTTSWSSFPWKTGVAILTFTISTALMPLLMGGLKMFKKPFLGKGCTCEG